MTLRERDSQQRAVWTPMARYVVAWAVSTLVTAMVGPFVTFSTFTFSERLFYWGALIALGLCFSIGTRRLATALCPDDGLAHEVISAALLAVTLGPVIWIINLSVLGFDVSGVLWFLRHILLVLVICLCIILVRRYLAIAAAQDRVDRPAAPKAGQRPVFMDHLPEPLPGNLRRVSANNHHLHVFTEHGEGRLLMRFRDAMVELESLPGYRIHRSHWVAQEALVAIRVEGRRHVARLTCGTELPVSQANLDALREAGLID
jgi:hypothetical protein